MVLRHKKKLQINSKLAGTTMWKSLRVSVGSEDEQSILFETSRFNRLFPEPTLTLKEIHMVVPARLLFIYTSFFFCPAFSLSVLDINWDIFNNELANRTTWREYWLVLGCFNWHLASGPGTVTRERWCIAAHCCVWCNCCLAISLRREYPPGPGQGWWGCKCRV